MDIPFWVNYLVWAVIILAGFVGLVIFNNWKLEREVLDKETGRKKMMAEIWGADGYPRRRLAAIDGNGRTVKIKNDTYYLNREKKEAKEGEPSYPAIRHILYPEKPFWIFGKQFSLRLESWAEGNSEPVKPFYGKFLDDKGRACDPDAPGAKFVQSRLMVTASEHTGIVNEAHLAAATAETEEIKAVQKSWRNILNNLPSKWVLYIGLFLCALLAGIGVVQLMSLKSALGF